MKREDIEEAANQRSFIETPDARERFLFRSGFKAGAEWRINSVWHDASETPISGKEALVKYITGDLKIKYRVDVFCGYEWKEMCHYDKLIQFAYIEDLIPNTEE